MTTHAFCPKCNERPSNNKVTGWCYLCEIGAGLHGTRSGGEPTESVELTHRVPQNEVDRQVMDKFVSHVLSKGHGVQVHIDNGRITARVVKRESVSQDTQTASAA